MKKNDGVLLASGGMDSTVLAYKLVNDGEEIIPLFLNYGQHCLDVEYESLKKHLPESIVNAIKVINISEIYNESNSRMIVEANLWKDKVDSNDLYLPYRNLLFLAIASAYAQSIGVKKVYSAFINSNHAKEIDCSYEFFLKMHELLIDYGSVEIHLPFREMTKKEVALLGISLNVPISSTFSCQVSSSNPCGACPNCVDRINALNSIIEEEINERF